MPTTQMLHVDRMLSNISIGYKNESFIADEIFKPVSVLKRSDRYYKHGMESFRVHDDKRAPGTLANEINWGLSSDTYYCEGHALAHFIPDEEKLNADAFDLEAEAVQLTTEGILMNKEVDAASQLLNATNYDATLVDDYTSTAKWDDYANSDPAMNIKNARDKMHKKSGISPNTLIVSAPVLSALMVHPKILSVLPSNQYNIASIELLERVFGVKLIVGKALKSTVTNPGGAAPGALEDLGYIWGNSAVLCYIAPKPGRRTQSIGYSFMWDAGGKGAIQVKKWYDIAKGATMVQAERWYAHKMVSNVAGFLFADVLT